MTAIGLRCVAELYSFRRIFIRADVLLRWSSKIACHTQWTERHPQLETSELLWSQTTYCHLGSAKNCCCSINSTRRLDYLSPHKIAMIKTSTEGCRGNARLYSHRLTHSCCSPRVRRHQQSAEVVICPFATPATGSDLWVWEQWVGHTHCLLSLDRPLRLVSFYRWIAHS